MSAQLERGMIRSAMRTARLGCPALNTVLFALCFLHAMAQAELQWYGDPDQGRAVFDNLNFEGAAKHSKGSGTIQRR